MTDLPVEAHSVPSRLGVSLSIEGERLVGRLDPVASVCERGTVPVAALVFLADVVAGLAVDTDPDTWTFTSDISVRAPLAPTPSFVEGTSITRRAGRRSITCEVPLSTTSGSWGTCFIGFARVERRAGDPPKPSFDVEAAVAHWEHIPPLSESLRTAMPVVSRDPAAGVVAVDLRPELLNPAGALQGAMVAYLAEAAAEDLADHHLADHHRGGGPGAHVVTEMDIRFLAQNRTPTIVSRAELVGPPEEGLVRVDLLDDTGRLTTAVQARVRRAPRP
jgi:acyl-coenzyme A thioesterase PaaI-like protein